MLYIHSVRPPRKVYNPPNPWQQSHVDWEGEPPPATLEVFRETARSALVDNDSPDLGFRWGLNPYRGCYHGCAYCYARPYHEYLGWGSGSDFERKIVVKENIAEVLRRELHAKRWRGERVALSGITDCYQPLEASFRLTRACLEVFLEFRNPVIIITKSSVIRRDAELLRALADEADCFVWLSIPFADDDTGRRIEPWASPVSRRFETLRILHEAGVPVGVAVAPIIPGLNDSHIPFVLERAREAGARRAFITSVRLPGDVKDVFHVRLRDVLPPARLRKIDSAVRELRGGKLDESAFHARMGGLGERWKSVEALFEQTCRRLGYEMGEMQEKRSTFRRPDPSGQLSLFEAPAVRVTSPDPVQKP
jgi:DNA repair photolyase